MINLNEKKHLKPDQNISLKRSLSYYSSLNTNTLPLTKYNKNLNRSITNIEEIKPIVHYSTLRVTSHSSRLQNLKENSKRLEFNVDQLIMSRTSSVSNGGYSLVDPNKIHLFVKVIHDFLRIKLLEFNLKFFYKF